MKQDPFTSPNRWRCLRLRHTWELECRSMDGTEIATPHSSNGVDTVTLGSASFALLRKYLFSSAVLKDVGKWQLHVPFGLCFHSCYCGLLKGMFALSCGLAGLDPRGGGSLGSSMSMWYYSGCRDPEIFVFCLGSFAQNAHPSPLWGDGVILLGRPRMSIGVGFFIRFGLFRFLLSASLFLFSF